MKEKNKINKKEYIRKERKDFTDYADIIDCDETYQSIIERDWLEIGAEITEVDYLKKELFIKLCREQGLMTKENIDSLESFFAIDTLLEKGIIPDIRQLEEIQLNTKHISGILKGFSDNSIKEICSILKKNAYLETFWRENSFINQKLCMSTKIQKDLNSTIRYLTSFINGIIKNYYNNCPDYLPDIVREQIINAVAPLAKAHTIAITYKKFIDSKLDKYGYKKNELTRRDEWNYIIVDLANIIHTEKEHNTRVIFLNKLIAKLLIEVYPSFWGKLELAHAEKLIKDRLAERNRGRDGYTYVRAQKYETEK